MGISVCMLIKNEEAQLGDCLECVYDLSDEIIIVDNGSTDNTISIANSYKCRVISCPDLVLDKGRNEYIKAAKEDWILVVDADERLDKRGRECIKEAVANAPDDVYSFLLPRYDYLGNGRWSMITMLRLFRNIEGIFYNDLSVHASPGPSIRALGGRTSYVNAPLHHLDNLMLKGRALCKRERYTELIKKEIVEHKGSKSLYLLHSLLGTEYSCVGRYDDAMKEYEKAKEIDYDFIPLAQIYIAQNYLLQNDYENTIKNAEILIGNGGVLEERAYTLLAEIEARRGDYAKARIFCENALRSNENATHHLINIASLSLQNDPELAINYIEKALTQNSYLLNDIIYKKGDRPNPFEQQISFLSTTNNIFKIMKDSYRQMGNRQKYDEWVTLEKKIL
ncbi:MAG: glycosyltransferase [Firmicutes bacterium]|nr:glycosyltransferase [Bacillota bacterium]